MFGMPIASNEELRRVLHFKPADLEANREGWLSEAQKGYLRRLAYRGTRRVVAIMMLLTLLTLTLIALPDVPIVCAAYSALPLLITLIVIWLLRDDSRRLDHEISLGHVSVAEGYPVRIARQQRQLDPDTGTHIDKTYHFICIGGQEFRSSTRIYAAFKDGARYRVYYLPQAQRIVAAEVIRQ